MTMDMEFYVKHSDGWLIIYLDFNSYSLRLVSYDILLSGFRIVVCVNKDCCYCMLLDMVVCVNVLVLYAHVCGNEIASSECDRSVCHCFYMAASMLFY
jgi:hypothetical protein